jgi:transcriptional regulator with XRE-family HTH domain
MENLSTVLTRLMAEKGISSAELARNTGVTQSVVYRLMTGGTENPQVLTLKPIADFFKVSLEQLLGFAPLNNQSSFDNIVLHNINTKLSTVKTVASVLVDLLPKLIDGYQKAITANLVKEVVSGDMLHLLTLSTANLLIEANLMQELLIINKNAPQD